MVMGRTRLDIGMVQFDDLVRESLELVRLAAANKGVRLEARIDAFVPAMRGDAARLKQVVSNLLANALKFTPNGGRVTVVLTSAGETLRLEVHDTGEGIPAAFLPHVFDRYRQASTTGPRGLGLGLAIVRHLVELHGGRVTASSAGPGRGSTFVVELPIAPVRSSLSA
jgi:signal transduction histidine kinase